MLSASSVPTNFVTHGLFAEAASSLRDGLNWEHALLDHSPLRCSLSPYPAVGEGVNIALILLLAQE